MVNSKALIEYKVNGKKHRCPFRNSVENTTLSTCKHCCLNRECAEYTIYYYQCIETSHRPRFKSNSKLSRTRQKKTGKQTFTDYVVLAIWAIGGQNFGRPVVKMVANATGRVLILLPVLSHQQSVPVSASPLTWSEFPRIRLLWSFKSNNSVHFLFYHYP